MSTTLDTQEAPDTISQEASRGRGRKVLATGIALSVIGLLGGTATWSAFKGTTDNPGNTFQAGTVTISDNDGGGAGSYMFNVTDMKPGQTETRCINVIYTGSLNAKVRMYGAATAGALNDNLSVVVKRGTVTGGTVFPACTGFADDATVSHTSTIATFPAVSDAGVLSTDTSWDEDEAHIYQVAVTLDAATADGEQGATAGPITFTWEAENN